MNTRTTRVAGRCALAVSFGLAACAGQEKLAKAQLAELVTWLPGRYDNLVQAEAAGAAAHEALALTIVPIYAPMLGDHVFYLQETAADDPRRVLDQRLLSFDTAEDGTLVQATFQLTDVLRWRDAHLNPDLFKSLMPQDVRPMQGCELRWTKTPQGFRGENDPQRCRVSSRVTGGMVFLESRAELGPDELALSARTLDASGNLVQGRATEPFYRFRKSGP